MVITAKPKTLSEGENLWLLGESVAQCSPHERQVKMWSLLQSQKLFPKGNIFGCATATSVLEESVAQSESTLTPKAKLKSVVITTVWQSSGAV